MSWLKRIFARSPSPDQTQQKTRSGGDLVEAMERSLREHAAEIEQALTPERRQKALALWRQTIDTKAHDFADLVLRYPDRDRIARLEVETLMQAYINGYMAAQGWIDPNLALHSAYLLGRRFRDAIRGLGISLNSVSANFGTVIDQTLASIVKLGFDA